MRVKKWPFTDFRNSPMLMTSLASADAEYVVVGESTFGARNFKNQEFLARKCHNRFFGNWGVEEVSNVSVMADFVMCCGIISRQKIK